MHDRAVQNGRSRRPPGDHKQEKIQDRKKSEVDFASNAAETEESDG